MRKGETRNLGGLDGFKAAVLEVEGDGTVDGLYCPNCGGHRRVRLLEIFHSGRLASIKTLRDGMGNRPPAKFTVPSMFGLTCVQCETDFLAVAYNGPAGEDIAILPSINGGLRTPNTPESVAYYLDQAQRAESVGARSAAVAMYRAALEHILFEQDFTVRMLGPKLDALDRKIKEGTAPRWAQDLDVEFLDVLKRLGNAAVHPGDGDVARQDSLDAALLADVHVVFEMVLDHVYERPRKTQELLSRLGKIAEDVEG